MAFKRTRTTQGSIESPEALLHDLRQKKIKGPLAHQADMWRDYVKNARDEKDVAFQLPTGSGKTLVGLILGEWRRRINGERILYICPTNQLVNQVTNLANNSYGLNVIPFTGKITDYPSSNKMAYQSGENIAISSYSALFNTNPFFKDPQVIILDDAHSSENYISSFWSLSIKRHEFRILFDVISSVLRGIISDNDFQKMTGTSENFLDFSWVGKLPIPLFFKIHSELTSILDTHCANTHLIHSWSLLREHLDACNLFYSYNEILIRPLIPPTETHKPFSDANQRIYMSATLGEGGDLERLTGRRNIRRLQIPTGWDKQGIGRRLFYFPAKSLEPEDVTSLTMELFKTANRSLILVPDENSAKRLTDLINETLDYRTFSAKEIEESKQEFITHSNAVAVMANRYDGIDFPDDECRMLYVEGLPRATNLQEKFIIQKMGASILLNDRILTRIVQAFGRCTRSSTDYALVEVIGDELVLYLMSAERRKYLHPELQAELQFGIDESTGISMDSFLENAKIFLEQKTEWEAAESSIISIRDHSQKARLPCAVELKEAVKDEVNYQYNLWKSDFCTALENCKNILGKLNDGELRGYRALWNYLAGSTAWLATKNKQADFHLQSKEYFSLALKNVKEINWLSHLVSLTDEKKGDYIEVETNGSLIEKFESSLEKMGILNNRRFDSEEKLILEGVEECESKKFESSQVHLGNLLGYDAFNEETTGSPDPWWKIANKICFVFEDYSEAVEGTVIPLKKARQVAMHPAWIKNKYDNEKELIVIPILVTKALKIDENAYPILKDVIVWNYYLYKEWVKNTLGIVRSLKSKFPGSGDLFWHQFTLDLFTKHNITPFELWEYLKKK